MTEPKFTPGPWQAGRNPAMAAAAIELWNSRAPSETKTNDLPLFLAAKEAAE